jgi:murein L,D-transpeptidase YcbB/YkuD
MKRPIEERLQQILINMETDSLVARRPSTDYFLVNIPEFRLHVYDKENIAGAQMLW